MLRGSDSERDGCVAVDSGHALQTLDKWIAAQACQLSRALRIDRSGQNKMPSHKRTSVAAGSTDKKQPNTANAEMHRAMIENDDPIVTTIIDSTSQVMIAKLVDNTDFTKMIVNSILQNGMADEVKQEICESCHMEVQEVAADINSRRQVNVEYEQLDALEQYNRRHCVIVHGMVASDDPEHALDLFGRTLGVVVGRNDSDRCHRLITYLRIKGKGGGIGIYISNKYQHKIRHAVMNDSGHSHFESVFIFQKQIKRRL